MNASERTGAALAATATAMVGSVVAASSLLVDYPALAGQAGLFAGPIPVAALASVAVVGASEISGTKLAGSLVVGAGIVLGLGGPGRPRPASPRPSG